MAGSAAVREMSMPEAGSGRQASGGVSSGLAPTVWNHLFRATFKWLRKDSWGDAKLSSCKYDRTSFRRPRMSASTRTDPRLSLEVDTSVRVWV